VTGSVVARIQSTPPGKDVRQRSENNSRGNLKYPGTNAVAGQCLVFPLRRNIHDTRTQMVTEKTIQAEIGYSAPAHSLALYLVNAIGPNEQGRPEEAKRRPQDLSTFPKLDPPC